MKPSECAKRVLDWAVRNAIEASVESLKAHCSISANLEAEKVWKEHNPDDGVGGFGCNPYSRNTEYLIKDKDRKSKVNQEAHEVLDFVKDRICKLIDKEA